MDEEAEQRKAGTGGVRGQGGGLGVELGGGLGGEEEDGHVGQDCPSPELGLQPRDQQLQQSRLETTHRSASDTNLKEAIEGGVGDVRVAPEHLRLHHQPRLLREPKPCTIYFPYSAHSEEKIENSQLLEFLTRACRSLEALSWRGPLQLHEPCQLNQNIFLHFNDTTFKVTLFTSICSVRAL